MKLYLLVQEKYQIFATCSDRGECQLLSFLNELEGVLQEQADRMLNFLERVAHTGPPRRYEVCHQIQGGIWQFRQGRIRVLWFFGAGPEIVVCSHGFMKASQRTPQEQIKRAEIIRRRYFSDLERGEIEILPD